MEKRWRKRILLFFGGKRLDLATTGESFWKPIFIAVSIVLFSMALAVHITPYALMGGYIISAIAYGFRLGVEDPWPQLSYRSGSWEAGFYYAVIGFVLLMLSTKISPTVGLPIHLSLLVIGFSAFMSFNIAGAYLAIKLNLVKYNGYEAGTDMFYRSIRLR